MGRTYLGSSDVDPGVTLSSTKASTFPHNLALSDIKMVVRALLDGLFMGSTQIKIDMAKTFLDGRTTLDEVDEA